LILQRALPFTLLLLILSAANAAIPLRSGPGNDYRIVHRGLPSGTRLEVKRLSGNKEFAEITTVKGTSGWIRTQYLMKDLPAKSKLNAALAKAKTLEDENKTLQSQAEALAGERSALLQQVSGTEGSLEQTSEELARLKQISGNAVQLDTDYRRLSLETEQLRSEFETLEAENQRLQDNLESEAFMNGAFAVLLGVVIALVVPRLRPKHRKSSSWA
jgi:SH3 domain protein